MDEQLAETETGTPILARLLRNLDSVLAWTAVGCAVLAFPLIERFQPDRAYILRPAPVALLVVSILYLLVRRWSFRDTTSQHLEVLTSNPRTYLITNILFLSFLLLSIIALATRPEPYERPVAYFVTTALMAALVAVEVFFLPKSTIHDYSVLTKTLVITFSLQLSQSVLYPGLLGVDAWWHSQFVQSLVAQGHIPTGSPYSDLSEMHVVFGSLQLITGASYKVVSITTMIFGQVAGFLSLYLIGRDFLNRQTALLALLILASAVYYIELSLLMIPNAFGLIFLLPILYVLLRVVVGRNPAALFVLLLLMVASVMTHLFAPLAIVLALGLLVLGFKIAKIGSGVWRRTRSPFMIGSVGTLSLLLLMFQWVYLSQQYDKISLVILKILRVDPLLARLAISTDDVGMKGIGLASFWEYTYFFLGIALYFGLAAFGLLYYFHRRQGSLGVAWGVMGVGLLTLNIATFSGFVIAYPERWFWVSVLVLSLPVASGLLLMFRPLNLLSRITAISAVVFMLAFVSSTAPKANHTTSVFSPNTMMRLALTTSEEHAFNLLGYHWERTPIKVDRGAKYPIAHHFSPSSFVGHLSPWLQLRDFSSLGQSSLVIVREMIIDESFWGRGGIRRLDYDLRELLLDQQFSRLYDSQSVTAFSRTLKIS